MNYTIHPRDGKCKPVPQKSPKKTPQTSKQAQFAPASGIFELVSPVLSRSKALRGTRRVCASGAAHFIGSPCEARAEPRTAAVQALLAGAAHRCSPDICLAGAF